MPEKRVVTIIKPDLRIMRLRLQSVEESGLICNRFSEAKLEDLAKSKKAKAPGPRIKEYDKNEEFRQALYMISPGVYGFPCSGIKKAAVESCSFTEGITKVICKGAFFVLGHLAEIHSEEPPELRQDPVRVGGKSAALRTRAYFKPPWYIDIKIRYDANVITDEQIAHLYNQAGFSVGLGDWRPQRAGSYGMFEVTTAAEETEEPKPKKKGKTAA